MTKEEIKQCLCKAKTLKSGEQAALRHNAAKPYVKADYQAVAAFLKTMPSSAKSFSEEALFPVVSCMCLWKTPQNGMPFAKAVASFKTDSTEKRFLSFIDEPLSEDSLFSVKLYRLMRMLATKGIDVDWEGFGYDLLYWNHPDRFVQKRWIREFYRMESDTPTTENTKEELS